MTKYYVDKKGAYLGGFDGAEPPSGAIEVASAPVDARQIWNGDEWGSVPATIPDRVSSLQFGLQMIEAGVKSQIDAWVADQDAASQWTYGRSTTFFRDDAMIVAAFTSLGYTASQIDAFFVSAAAQ